MRCDPGIGYGFVDTDLYLIGYFLHIRLSIDKSVMGGNRYIIQYRMCSNTGIIEGFAGLYLEIVCHFGFNSFSRYGFNAIIVIFNGFLSMYQSSASESGYGDAHHFSRIPPEFTAFPRVFLSL
jgi:hypothetical protein